MHTAGISDKVLLPLVAGLVAGIALVVAGLAGDVSEVWGAGLTVITTALAGAGIGFKARPSPVELGPQPKEKHDDVEAAPAK